MRRLLVFFYACIAFNLMATTHSSRPYCEETSWTYLNPVETPLGFSGEDLLRFARSQEIKITYPHTVGSTNGYLYVVPSVGARYIMSFPVYPPCTNEDGCPDIGIVCDDRVEIDAMIGFTSDDGTFSGDVIDATLMSSSEDGTYAELEIKIESSNLVGNNFTESPYWIISGRFTSAGFTGEMFHWSPDCEPSDGPAVTCAYTRMLGATFSPALSAAP